MVDNGQKERVDDNWVLTDKGMSEGGIVKNHSRLGSYIAWDEKNKTELEKSVELDTQLLNATELSNISPYRDLE